MDAAERAQARPIFVHAFLRAGGTYLWSKFRASPSLMAFYEPFNEALGSDTRGKLLAKTPGSWSSKHPLLAAPYMAEYAPLLSSRGLPRFHKEFSAGTFFPPDAGELPPEQGRYLTALIEHARGMGRRPVLAFSRSLGRVPSLARAFDACHILLMRNPAHHWMSCFRQSLDHGNDYFLVMHLLIAGQNRHHPLVRAVAERYEVPFLERRSVADEISAYRKLAARLDLEASYRVFLALYVAGYLEALAPSDLAVDMNLLGHAVYRRSIEERIEALTGVALDLGDARMPSHALADAGIDFARCHRDALEDAMRHWQAYSAAGAERAQYLVRAKLEEASRGYLEELRDRGLGREARSGEDGSAAAREMRETRLLAGLNQTKSRLKAAEARLDMVMQSTSWRATAPLRRIVDLLRDAGLRPWAGGLSAALKAARKRLVRRSPPRSAVGRGAISRTGS